MGECEDFVDGAIEEHPGSAITYSIRALAQALDIRFDDLKATIPAPLVPEPGPFSINTETAWNKFNNQSSSEQRISALIGALRPYLESDHDESHAGLGPFSNCQSPKCIKARALLGE